MSKDDLIQVMDADEIRRAVTRISHEIIERNHGASELLIVGVQKKGVPLARRIRDSINQIERVEVPFGRLDISLYRDDFASRAISLDPTNIPEDVTGKTIILVDDVMFTGRSVRSAMEALIDFGRPAAIQLAVLVDRGHRELPIRADYIGKNLPTSRKENVEVELSDCPADDRVMIRKSSDQEAI